MILNNVKRLLQISITDYSKDEFLSTIIELTLAKVKALCNITEDNFYILKDDDFNLLIAQIVVDIYMAYVPSHKIDKEVEESDPKPGGNIKSVQIGDYKVEYATENKTSSYKTNSISDSIKFHLDKYDEELVNYRFIRFY